MGLFLYVAKAFAGMGEDMTFSQLRRVTIAFLHNESGATAIEYALIASLLSMAIIGSAFLMGGGVQNMWDTVKTEVLAGVQR